MRISEQIAKHFREVVFGGNWTFSNFKEQLEGITWEQATTQVYDLNSIATLVYHVFYYMEGVASVLENGPLTGKDKFSFDHPPINSQEDWETFLESIWINAEAFAKVLEQVPDEKMGDFFSDEKYGIYYRNLHGIVEHAHYHLGQICYLKKILLHHSAS